MDQKIVFRELLSEIREKAIEQGRRISRAEVESFFAHADLTKEHLDMICSYLEEQRISVEDGENTPSPEESSYLEQYIRELEEIRAPQAAEELELFRRVVKKDPKAREQLAELYLQTVCSLAAEYEGEDLSGEDLLQEGSVGLLLALDSLTEKESLAAYRTCLFNEVNRHLEQVIAAHKDLEDAGSAALKKVERLDEAMQSLMEDLGRKVTMEELSAFLEIPVSEIRDIAKLAGDDLEFADSAGDTRMPWEI